MFSVFWPDVRCLGTTIFDVLPTAFGNIEPVVGVLVTVFGNIEPVVGVLATAFGNIEPEFNVSEP